MSNFIKSYIMEITDTKNKISNHIKDQYRKKTTFILSIHTLIVVYKVDFIFEISCGFLAVLRKEEL